MERDDEPTKRDKMAVKRDKMAAEQGQRDLLYTCCPDYLSQGEWSGRMAVRVEGSGSVGCEPASGTTCQQVTYDR